MFGKKRRTYRELQTLILKTIQKEELTTYEIVKKTKLHFHVVKRQLILLKGEDYVSLTFKHKQFKLFTITKEGLKYLRKITR